MIEAHRIFMEVARSFLGTLYEWGGDDPTGIDCSGLVVECLKSSGKVPPQADLTADGLYHRFKGGGEIPYGMRQEGDLAFWFKGKRAIHVGIVYSKNTVLEAGGGDSTVKTAEDADRKAAFVRIRPLEYRGHRPIIVSIFK